MEHRHPKRENLQYQVKVITFIINFGGNKTDRCKSKKGASASEPHCLKMSLVVGTTVLVFSCHVGHKPGFSAICIQRLARSLTFLRKNI